MKHISKKRIFILALSFVMVMSLVFIKSGSNASADIRTAPDFTVSIDSVEPLNAKVNEDITISGTLYPKDFQAPVPEKDIVLVLDVSGSMGYEIEGSICTEGNSKYCIIHHSSECVESPCNWVWKWSFWGSGWYCTEHNCWHGGWFDSRNHKPEENCDNNQHKFIYDYCPEHDTFGRHNTTKIAELKKAARNFVDKMKDVPNLKIGVVTFSDRGNVDTSNLIDSGNTDKLNNVINNISAYGGTNTGDGLRKAAYLLQKAGGSDANKSIVMMSDGVPTNLSFESYKYKGYSIHDNGYGYYEYDYKYYKEIDDSEPDVGGYGSDYDPDADKYANEMAEILKKDINNVFTIGYGLGDSDSDDNQTLKGIHNSMGGSDDNFFASDNGAIESVFSKVADEILKSYAISNIKMDYTLPDGLVFKIGDKDIDIPNVVYKTDGKADSQGMVTYKAEPVKFQFKIIASKPGDYKLLDKAKMKVPWKDKTIEIEVPNININVVKNDDPNIYAELKDKNDITAQAGSEVKISYELHGDDFAHENSSDNKKDVIFVLDTSSSMENYIGTVEAQIFNYILGKVDGDVRYSIVTYNKDASLVHDFTSNVTDLNDNYLKKITTSKSNDRNLNSAMYKVCEQVGNARSDSAKYVVFIGGTHQIYNPDKELENKVSVMKNSIKKFITLAIPTENDNMKTLHTEKFGGIGEDYIETSKDGAVNDINNGLMGKVAERIKGTGMKEAYAFNVDFNFDLNGNFDISDSDMASIKNITVTYKYDSSKQKYVMEKHDPVELKVKVKDGRTGRLTFGNDNYIEYKSLGDTIQHKNIEVPIINVISPVAGITHGIDLGISSGSYNVKQGSMNIASDMDTDFASTAVLYSNKVNINLYIDKNIDVYGADGIKVYQFDGDKLNKLDAEVTDNGEVKGSNNYSIKIKDEIKPDTMVVIKYTCRLPKNDSEADEKSYKNLISYNDQYKDVIVNSKPMPKLF